ncbi:polyamine ABC transporter substrate-binding protein [Heliophilum fasciatum]|uniref:Spermidine/putrescine transport system substrate-binding protein n=1 Tax=Heliophilum fasciatum TaxID=35700 RepID=A0A4R2RG88_9FIRM|nr:spermidine/putrescine ABC transporter substrate-binding protein [Heliophilum fasciatum]MCW2278616.1 spermidine/putrescine transport system substrate-binding protein [Heliophilum fasciatum]TCP62682.1 spermidine/putrescine transport system substrate-binding protein [Heliophilum fasciatum]
MRKWMSLGIVALLWLGLLTDCGAGAVKNGQASGDKVLHIYSWPGYFNPEVLADFEKKYGIKVKYDVFSSNEEMLKKIQTGSADYDLIVPTDYMVDKLVQLGLLAEFNKGNIPNARNLRDNFQTLFFDSKETYSIVYTWGVTGIAYNREYVKTKPESWQELWNPAYKGRVALLNDPREILGMGLIKNGFSNSTNDEVQIKVAFTDLQKLLPNVMAFDSETIKEKFISNEYWIGTVWAGDAAFIHKHNPNVEFSVPQEGTMLWIDSLAIPKGAKHKQQAEQFINYLLEPEVSVKNYEWIEYSNPNKKALELHSREYLTNLMIHVNPHLKRAEQFTDVGDMQPVYDRYWTMLRWLFRIAN